MKTVPTNPPKVNHVERARRYVAKIKGAVSGSNGSAETFAVAMVLVHGFNLDFSTALMVLAEFNQRCEPQWSEPELRHKIESAIATPARKGRGYLLENNSQKTASQLAPVHVAKPHPSPLPDQTGFAKGTSSQIQRLADSRPFGLEGLKLATKRGLLVFGDWHGNEVYGVTDSTKRVLEIRRVDQKPFPAVPSCNLNERKSHAIKGSQKSWPLGIVEAEKFPCIVLVEGIPDFLEAHYLSLWEGATSRVGLVAMLSASPMICEDALAHFKNKTVRIFPHVDKSGLVGAERWRKQLLGAGAAKVDMFDFSPYRTGDGKPICDLFDFQNVNPVEFQLNHGLWRILP